MSKFISYLEAVAKEWLPGEPVEAKNWFGYLDRWNRTKEIYVYYDPDTDDLFLSSIPYDSGSYFGYLGTL